MLPAERSTVEDFAVWSLDAGYRIGTVVIRLCAITAWHSAAGVPSPVDKNVRELLCCARRELRERRQCKRALTYEMLRRIAKRFRATPGGIRDRAMTMLCFAAGWRRSEIVALRRRDVELSDDGIALWQGVSKTDQRGEGRLVGIPPGNEPLTCPVRALKAWLAIRGDWDGPLFTRMNFRGEPTHEGFERHGKHFAEVLKRELAALGEDPAQYGAHSLRAGMITEAAKSGASDVSIMQRTGHRCHQTLLRYIRPAKIFDFDPLKNVL